MVALYGSYVALFGPMMALYGLMMTQGSQKAAFWRPAEQLTLTTTTETARTHLVGEWQNEDADAHWRILYEKDRDLPAPAEHQKVWSGMQKRMVLL